MDSTTQTARGVWCHLCGPGQPNCYVRCMGQGGTWTQVEGCPDAANNGMYGSKTLCAKGNALLASADQSNRLLYPLRRVGSKGPGARFERITWDEALDRIAETLQSQKETYGPETFGILSPQFYDVTATLGRRFLNVHGSPNYLHSAICHIQRNASIYSVLGGANANMPNSTVPAQLDKTELLVCWGVNTENSGVNKGDPRRRLRSMQRGMKVVDIRPACDPLASKADVWLPIRPGTDLALALAILHVIRGEGIYDHDFVANHTEGFAQLAEHVKQFTPAWAQERCGIPSAQIEEVARAIAAANPCGIMHGNGIGDQSRDGHWTLVCIQLIGALCGNLGKPGGGCDAPPVPPLAPLAMPSTLADRLPQSAQDAQHGWPAGTSKLVAPEFPRGLALPGCPINSSYHGALRSVLTGKPYPMRALFAQATNPLSATRQPKLVAQALEAVDFFFCMDIFANPACDYADIVLPAALQTESDTFLGLRNGPAGTFVALSHKLADPPGEARPDAQFYLDLACRMGYGGDFWQGSMDALLEERLAPSGYTLEQLREAQDGIFVRRTDRPKAPTAESIDYDALFAALPNHKVQCTHILGSGMPDIYGVDPLPPLPIYRGPIEGLAETPDLVQEFPYAFSDVHAHRLSQHSNYDYVGYLRAIEPDPWMKIHSDTAAAHGIAEGDWVRVESPHGQCVLKARLTRGIARDVLMGRRGWWQACPSLGLAGYAPIDGGAETSVLYANEEDATDRFHSAMGKQTLVRIAKSDVPSAPFVSHAESTPQATTTAVPHVASERAPIEGMRTGRFSFLADLCIKCHACEVACQQAHGFAPGQPGFRKVTEQETGDVPHVRRAFLSQRLEGCDLCQDAGGRPHCVTTCPTGAITWGFA